MLVTVPAQAPATPGGNFNVAQPSTPEYPAMPTKPVRRRVSHAIKLVGGFVIVKPAGHG
ncbi:hypothetical protein IQ249_25355 [Lusitaniella coriacea LEGE 07157]|uniref:Uncharacterized protein n=1 Tax=Lusitaniella coriacea LEGE 07157 TaxID=945747 RepID=A0A8J7E0G4_9CYAN|nr:hypothetical protein [Lusitaniella coriacea]MBE9119181.1 hypothetical protein [Lusitaniella coriacea LEGE 07157]